MKRNKCYSVPVVLYVMSPNKKEAERLVKRRVAIEQEKTISNWVWPNGSDFVGIIGQALRWDDPEKFEKKFRKAAERRP